MPTCARCGQDNLDGFPRARREASSHLVTLVGVPPLAADARLLAAEALLAASA